MRVGDTTIGTSTSRPMLAYACPLVSPGGYTELRHLPCLIPKGGGVARSRRDRVCDARPPFRKGGRKEGGGRPSSSFSAVAKPMTSVLITSPTHNREPYDTLLYCPTSCPYRSVCGTDAACSSNTIRDSISRVAPSQRGPRSAPALRHARRPCALTRGRPTVPRRPGTGRSRRTARRAALAPAVLR
jgi:hypothetical protein